MKIKSDLLIVLFKASMFLLNFYLFLLSIAEKKLSESLNTVGDLLI